MRRRFGVRRAGVLIAVACAAVVAAVVVLGLRQARDGTTSDVPAISDAGARRLLAASPPGLAQLHALGARPLLQGAAARLAGELGGVRGHPAVVALWATWCTACTAEGPIVRAASIQLGRRVAFLGVATQDPVAARSPMRARYGRFMPSIDDPGGELLRASHAPGLPVTLFYDAQGHRTMVHTGAYPSLAALRADIARYTRR
jgi:hypothetical protein